MSIPEQYKVDHLFLLVGENPLPNYVAARLLLNKDGTLYLVYTTGTKNNAERLEDILQSELNGLKQAHFVSLGEYESDANYIKNKISSKLGEIKTGKIGLNYTGGTKAMSVHAYRALFYEKNADQSFKKRPDIIFSYLDPRRLEMCIDREEGKRERFKVNPEDLQVKLEKLFQIHGLELKSQPIQEPQLPKLAEKLAELYQDEDITKQWFKWFYEEFCQQACKKKPNGSGGNWKSKTELLKLLIPVTDLPITIKDFFEQEDFLTSDSKLSFEKINQKKVFTEKLSTKLEHFCKLLHGIWLEHYVLQQIKTITEKNKIHNYGLNFEIPFNATKNKFEFDVAFMRGYQLFAISCTTDKKKSLCKSKLFEAYIRAQQMGGSEARVALVCCYDNPNLLKAEIAATIADPKIAVFGRDDLINLSQKIVEWIRENDREVSK